MQPLTLKRALHLLHVRTAALEQIRRQAGEPDVSICTVADLSATAGHALTIGPSESQLVALLANMPTPCETGGGLACPRCGWDSLQPSDDPPETVAAHRRGCPASLAAGPVGVECEHGFDVCPTCDRCTCNDAPRDCSPAARRVNIDRNADNPCPRCVGVCFVTIRGGGWILCETCNGSGRGPVAVVAPEVAAAFGLREAGHVKIRQPTGEPKRCGRCQGRGYLPPVGPAGAVWTRENMRRCPACAGCGAVIPI